MSRRTVDHPNGAWVLVGGGLRGAAEVGMARALAAAGLHTLERHVA